jgi:two-component system, NtrC family, sensor histidine kinase HydH
MKGERIVVAPYRWPIRILLGTLAVISAGLIAVTLLNYHTTSRLAEQALQNTGLSMALEVAAEARALGARDAAALQALVARQHRREIAYLSIGERDGTIIAHTNPRLAGNLLDDAAFIHARDTGRLVGDFVVLGTGEEVYELTVPFHIPPAGPGGQVDLSQPRFRILRIALHTAPARKIVYQAQAQLLFAVLAVLVLAGLGAWQVRTLRRYFILQQESAWQERLAALGEMAAVLAHEIRNPLGAIKGLAQFLGEKQAADPAQSEMTRTIADEATRLERLVNDLLTYARPRPPKRQPTDLPGVLDEVLRWVGPAANAAGVVCRLDVAGNAFPVSADAEQLKQLFGNLVLNAIQAMPTGGRMTLTQRTLDGKSRTRRAVEVAVEDTGTGISEADLPRIFEPFYTTRSKGTGLGLAICTQITAAHGGTIRVARTGPEGTTILVTLPTEGAANG